MITLVVHEIKYHMHYIYLLSMGLLHIIFIHYFLCCCCISALTSNNTVCEIQKEKAWISCEQKIASLRKAKLFFLKTLLRNFILSHNEKNDIVLHWIDNNTLLRICFGSSHAEAAFPVLMYVLLLDYELLIIEGNSVSIWENKVAFGTFLPKWRADPILWYLFVE